MKTKYAEYLVEQMSQNIITSIVYISCMESHNHIGVRIVHPLIHGIIYKWDMVLFETGGFMRGMIAI